MFMEPGRVPRLFQTRKSVLATARSWGRHGQRWHGHFVVVPGSFRPTNRAQGVLLRDVVESAEERGLSPMPGQRVRAERDGERVVGTERSWVMLMQDHSPAQSARGKGGHRT